MKIQETTVNSNQHADRVHALCSASGSSRWLNCPGSVALCREAPKVETSSYALEGTKAHELAEKYITNWMAQKPFLTYETEDREMAKHIEFYVEFVKEHIKPLSKVRIESKLVLSDELNMWGTADVAITEEYLGQWNGKIIDLKYGKTKVIAKGNSQLAYYAAALMMTSKQKLENVEVFIVQPRINKPITSIKYTREELMIWHGVLIRAAEKCMWQIIDTRKREYVMGDWCKYCDAKQICPERNKPSEGEATEFYENPNITQR